MTDEDILNDIIRREAGFVNDPDDRGKATNYGITIYTLSDWLGRPATEQDVRDMDVEVAKDIYRARYIKPFDGIEPAELRAQLVDIGVNSGVSTARAIFAKASQQTDRPVAVQLVIERLRHYIRIAKRNPSQLKFLEGWLNRAVEFL